VLNARGGSPEEARRRWERIAREGRPRARYACIVLVGKANCTGRMGRGVPLCGLPVWMYIHMGSVVRSCDKGGGWCRAGSRGVGNVRVLRCGRVMGSKRGWNAGVEIRGGWDDFAACRLGG
jgi:hypothetical protein